eukprot:122857-Chlamydomonas_euryale.AAC.3
MTQPPRGHAMYRENVMGGLTTAADEARTEKAFCYDPEVSEAHSLPLARPFARWSVLAPAGGRWCASECGAALGTAAGGALLRVQELELLYELLCSELVGQRERVKPYKLNRPSLVPTARNPTQLGLTTSNPIESRPQQRKDRQGQASPPAEQQEPSSASETVGASPA